MTARRRSPAARYAVVLLGLLFAGAGYTAITEAGSAGATAPNIAASAQVSQGRAIFLEECATCHGKFAQGTAGVAPSLIGVGAAAVDFQVSTGRMPAKENGPEQDRKPPELNPSEIKALAAYIASLGGGPPVPSAGQVSATAPTRDSASSSS